MQKPDLPPTGTYKLPNGETATIYNPNDEFLTWVNGQWVMRPESGGISECITQTENNTK